jgi:DNA-binding transcriptional MerR regulator
MTTTVKIPKRVVYKAAEVCAIAKLQPYVLRSWEAEFPDLGVEQPGSRPRVYRRVHLDKVLRIKELLFVEGLTLGAARRKILKDTPAADGGEQAPLAELLDADAQARVENVKAGLRSILSMLTAPENGNGVLPLKRSDEGDAAPAGPTRKRASRKTAAARPASNAGSKRRKSKS